MGGPASLEKGFSMSIKTWVAAVSTAVFGFGAANAAAVLEQVSPTPTTYDEYSDFTEMFGSPVTDITAFLDVPVVATGCSAGSFAGFNAGSIAFVSRGTCTFREKALFAQSAGAVGILIYNNIPGIPLTTLLNGDMAVLIPGLFLTQDLGTELLDALRLGSVQVRMATDGDPVPLPGAMALFLVGAGLLRRGKRT